MTAEYIETAAEDYALRRAHLHSEPHYQDLACREAGRAFRIGANYALSHQWTSVDERLPEKEAMVVAHSPNGRIDVLKYHDEVFIDELGQVHCVDYFIPIPLLNPESN